MRFWWVNQNRTYKYEVPGGFLWSPKTRNDGVRNPFYDSMGEVQPGDVVFSFCDTLIKAVGIVQRAAVTAPKPDFRTAGSNWSETGWFVEVEFSEVQRPIRPKSHMDLIRPLLEIKYAPLQHNGNGIQNVYLTEISPRLGSLLLDLSNMSLLKLESDFTPNYDMNDESAMEQEVALNGLMGDVEAVQVVKARRGQGVFKANLRMIERACRVTGLSEVKHLRASHIKPWSESTNEEKLDGYNGLLLSPHVDHLFDRGFISFEDDGDLLVSRDLHPTVLNKWGISPTSSVGGFHARQKAYLEYHRDAVFLG